MGGLKQLAVLVLVAIGACLGAAAAHAAAEAEPVTVGVPHDLYPEYAISADDRPGGFGVDVINAVAKRAGLSVTYRVFPTWSDTLAALEHGEIDLIPVVTIIPAREQTLLLTRPVLTSSISIFVRQDEENIRSVAELAGRRMGVIKGGSAPEWLGKGEAAPILVPYSRVQDEVFALLLGEVDAIITVENSVWKLAESVGVAHRIKVVGKPVTEAKRAIAIRRDLPGLRDRLDAVVADFLNSREYSSIYAAWHAEPPSFWTAERIAWAAGASVALLLLGMLLWQSLSPLAQNRQQSEIKERHASDFLRRPVSRTCALIALALGFAVLWGWAFDVAMFRTMLPGLVAMQPWTAITIALAGGALLLATIPGRIAAASSVALAGVVLIIGVQMFLQSATGLDFGTDRWFFPEAVGNQPRYPHPGRPAEATSIAVALLGAMLLFARVPRAWARAVFSIIGTVGLLLMAAALVGHLIGVGALQSAAFITPVALNTALGLAILFLGALVLRPDTGWIALLAGAGPGAASARMLLPVTLVGPLLLAWLFAVGKQAGLYGPEFQVGLDTLATMALLTASLVWSAAGVDSLHRARLATAEALRQSERQARAQLDELETIYRTAPVGLALYDRDLHFVRINSALADINGVSIEKHLGRYVWDVVPHLRGAVDLHFRKVLETGETVAFEASGETPKAPGVQRDWVAYYYPLKGSDGSVVAVGAIVQEITERKRAEAALRESEARYRTAGEAIRYGVWICNTAGGVEFVSRTFLDMVGKTLDEVKPRGWLDRLPPEDLKPTLDAWRECVRTGSEWNWEYRVRGKDGVWRTILSLGRPVRDDRDRITSWVGFNLDISGRKEVEDALRESEARFRGTFENAAVGIANVGTDGTWLRVNQRLCEILGYSRAELLQKSFQEITHPEDLPFNLDRFTALMRGEIDTYQLEKRYLRKDGHTVWVDLTAAVQRDQAGNPAYCIAIIEDIGARKRAEQALRESEARLRRTVENAPFPIMVHAEDGQVVHLSRAWMELTGYAREEIGTIAAWTDRAYGERKELVRTDINKLYALDRAVNEGEYRIRTADGRMRLWAFSSAPVGSDDRGRRLVVSMAADVTERKEAERALRESEIRMRALLDASQDEILLVSVAGEVLAINKAAERRLARRTGGAEPVGAHLNALLPQDQVEERMAIVRQVASTARLIHYDTPIRGRWFEFWFYPVLESDKAVSEVAVYAREVTEQKKSQADLSKLFQAVQQSPMSVVITDRDGTIEYVNPEFTKVTGYTLAEAIGRNPRILKSEHTAPEQYAELWKTISQGGVWRGELLNKKKDGELFWELTSIAPVKEGDKIINFVAVKEDITGRKEIEEQLRQSQKMQAVGQLTGGIAHDFNNLLAIIIGNLQLLGERPSSDAKAREYLDDALWSARRGGELTHRLLAFARKQPLKPTFIDFNEVVRGMTDLLRRTLGASIRVEESLTPNLWKAFADRGELERALVNLAVNARDAMRSTGTLTLETRNAVLDEDYAEQYEEVTRGEYVLLAVTDTGTGMSPEIVSRVFEPFFTTKEVGQGSGLGLSMVYGFVKQSGGHVSIYSQVGQGTSVKLYLPRGAMAPAQPEEGPPDMPPEGFGEKVVLVVEDEAKLRKLAVKMLDRLRLRSVQAETAKDALELLADTHVDVLFTDIELPGGMNGTELAEAAQKLAANIKVLFTTGYAREAVLHDKWLQEKVPWLLKPYSYTELARELKALLAPTVH